MKKNLMSFSYILASNQKIIYKFDVLFQRAPIFIPLKQARSPPSKVEYSYNKMSALVILDAKDDLLYHTHMIYHANEITYPLSYISFPVVRNM
jgi:hypothetical protein